MQMQARKNKRFIAGAKCPACGQVDKLFTYEVSADRGQSESTRQKFRACTRCDFDEPLRFEANRTELQTRVNSVDAETSPVQILDLKN